MSIFIIGAGAGAGAGSGVAFRSGTGTGFGAGFGAGIVVVILRVLLNYVVPTQTSRYKMIRSYKRLLFNFTTRDAG